MSHAMQGHPVGHDGEFWQNVVHWRNVWQVQLSCTLVSNSLQTHGLQHSRLLYHQLLELAQTHVRRVNDAIQSSHPLSSPFPPAFSLYEHQGLYQHQGLFKWVRSSHQTAKVLEFQLQHQFFQWIFRTDFLFDGLVGSRCSPRDSQESSATPQFKSIYFSALSFLYSPNLTSIWLPEKPYSFD